MKFSNALSETAIWLSRFRARSTRSFLKFLKVTRQESVALQAGEFPSELKTQILASYSANVIFETVHSRDANLQTFAFQQRNLIEISGVNLDTKTGMLFNKRNQIIEDSSSWPSAQLILNSIPRPLWPQRIEVTDESNYILLPGNSFYHWLIEDLAPFLFSFSQIKNPTVMVYSDAPSYVHEFVETLQTTVVKVPRFLSLKHLVFTTKNPSSGWPEAVDIELLREHFSYAFTIPEIDRKIYISRLKSTRSPLMEAELTEILFNEGWQILYAEDMGLLEQIKTISSARVICGVGGAGLAHITWLSEGAKVIELSPNWYVPCFSRLSQVLGIEYTSIFFEQNSMSASDVYREISSIVNSTP